MINSINSSLASAMYQAPRMDRSQSLSEEQQQVVKDTLANFKVDELSASDAASIVNAFSEGGIRPGAALKAAMADARFDAKTVGDMAGNGHSQPSGPPPGGGGQVGQLNLNDEMMSNLDNLLDEYLGGTVDGGEQESLLAEIRNILVEGAPEGGLVSIKV